MDKTCGVTEQCGVQMDAISELLSSLKMDNKNNNPKIAYIEIHSSKSQIVISLNNDRYQEDTQKYIDFVKNRECGDGFANGETDTSSAIIKAIKELTRNGHPRDAMQKIVIVSNCKNTGDDLCDSDIIDDLNEQSIEVVMLNAIGGSARNRLSSSEAREYKLCLTDFDDDRICVASDITTREYSDAIKECVPEICKYVTPNPSINPTFAPSENPTMYPTNDPTFVCFLYCVWDMMMSCVCFVYRIQHICRQRNRQ